MITMNSSSIFFSYNWEQPWSFKHGWNCKIQPLILQQLFCRCTMTHTHEFTELNKNLKRIQVSLVGCLGKDWARTVAARGKEPCGTPSWGCPWGWRAWAHPTSLAREQTGWGAARAPLSPTARHTRSCTDTPSLGPIWNVCQSGSRARQGWDKAGDGVTYNLDGDSPKRLSWNGVHFNAFHSAKSSS